MPAVEGGTSESRCPHGHEGVLEVHEELSKKFGGTWNIYSFHGCAKCEQACGGYPKIAFQKPAA